MDVGATDDWDGIALGTCVGGNVVQSTLQHVAAHTIAKNEAEAGSQQLEYVHCPLVTKEG
jgi:hypothetical protein